MHDLQRALVLIDGSNIYHAQRKMGWLIDWTRLLGYLGTRWALAEVRYYVGTVAGDTRADAYLEKLSDIGIKLCTKPVKNIVIRDPGHVGSGKLHTQKANFDVEISVDAMRMMGEYDVLVLVSGDGDFRYLIETLRADGRRVVVISERRTIAWELRQAANSFVLLEDLRGTVERKASPGR